MLTTIQAVGLALLQGATELFPVSSLGHAVVLPALLHWNIDEHSFDFLPFLVMLHLGTATALLAYFWRDWWALGRGVVGWGGAHERDESRRVLVLIVIATIPAVIIGFLLEHFLRRLFGAAVIAAAVLLLNGFMLMAGERLRGRGRGRRELSTLTMTDAIVIGCWQCLALVPGFSRSGATMVGALLRGIGHEGAAHFSFLIATPVILGATVLEVPKLRHAGAALGGDVIGLSALAAVIAGITAYASTAFLMRYFRGHESWALDPFAYYCFAAGAGSLAVLLLR